MKTIGIYPGTFQPPHKGHKKAYEKLRQFAGPDTFVVTTDYNPSLEAALHYGDKEQILVRHGIPDSHVRKVRNLNNPVEVLENFDPESTVVIYAFNRNEAAKKINASSYYKSLNYTGKLLPFKTQAYIVVVDEDITAKNKEGKLKSYTSKNIREALGSQRWTRKQKESWFKTFFGWFDLGLFNLLTSKYGSAHQAADGFEGQAEPEDIKEALKDEICNILNELMGDPPSIATDSSYGPDSVATDDQQSDAERRREANKQKQDLNKQKMKAERELKSLESDLKWKKNSVLGLRKDQIPSKRDELDQINQQLSQAATNPPTPL